MGWGEHDLKRKSSVGRAHDPPSQTLTVHRTVLEGWRRMGARVSEGYGGHLKARGSKQEEELRRKQAVMLPASARLPGWRGKWRQLPRLQGLADLVVQSGCNWLFQRQLPCSWWLRLLLQHSEEGESRLKYMDSRPFLSHWALKI